MNLKQYSLVALLILVAFSVGRFLGPKEVEIKEVETVVYKERETKEEDKQTRSTRRETVSPDGTRTIEIIRESDKKSRTDSRTEIESERSLESKSSNQSNWSIGIYKGEQSYLGTVDMRVIGGVFVGVYGRSDLTLNNREYGVGLRLEF